VELAAAAACSVVLGDPAAFAVAAAATGIVDSAATINVAVPALRRRSPMLVIVSSLRFSGCFFFGRPIPCCDSASDSGVVGRNVNQNRTRALEPRFGPILQRTLSSVPSRGDTHRTGGFGDRMGDLRRSVPIFRRQVIAPMYLFRDTLDTTRKNCFPQIPPRNPRASCVYAELL
jgi:hypothetical protein